MNAITLAPHRIIAAGDADTVRIANCDMAKLPGLAQLPLRCRSLDSGLLGKLAPVELLLLDRGGALQAAWLNRPLLLNLRLHLTWLYLTWLHLAWLNLTRLNRTRLSFWRRLDRLVDLFLSRHVDGKATLRGKRGVEADS